MNYATIVKDKDGEGMLNHIVDITAGRNVSGALGSDRVVYSWGLNSYGQLGMGNTVNK